MGLTKCEEERIDYFVELARKKGYREETIEVGIMLAFVKEVVAKYGSEEKSFEEVIKICEQCDDGSKFVGLVYEHFGLGK